MKFKVLKIQNFLSVGKDFVFPFEPGLTLITGKNKDVPKAMSNGAGKSTILEAIAWCLWGETIRGLKADEVVNESVGKNCKVSLLLEEEDTTYEITRYRKYKKEKPNDLVLKIKGKNATQASVAQTQKHIDSLLGMDLNTFCSMMPGAGVRVASLTDKAIKSLLESILKTEELAQAHSLAVEKRKGIKLDLDKKLSKFKFLEEKISSSKERIEEYKTSYNDFSKVQQAKIEALEEKKKEKDSQKAGIEEQLKEIDETLDKKASLIREGILIRIKDRVFSCSQQLFLGDHNKASLKKASINTELKALYKAKEEAPSGNATCPCCGQFCSEEVVSKHLTEIEKKIGDLNSVLKQEELKISSSEKCERKVKSIRSGIRAASLKNEKALNKIKMSNNSKAYIVKNKKALFKDISNISKEIEKVEEEENPFESLLKKEKKELSSFKKDLSTLKKEIKLLEKEENKLAFWVNGFSASGLRSYMLNSVVPILNKRAEYYCSLLTNNELFISFNTQTSLKSGKVVEKFSVDVEYEHGASSWKGASAGEKARVDLILSLCLGDLAAMRSKKRLSFRFMDEPFENIDEAGVEAVTALLQQQIKEYPCIYVITHNSAFADMFSKTFTVVKEKGITRVNNE